MERQLVCARGFSTLQLIRQALHCNGLCRNGNGGRFAEDAILEGCDFGRVMEISLNLKIWEDPKEFKLERFLNSSGGEERDMDAARNHGGNESSQFYDSKMF
ncbi:hypothetical protein CK203_094683 [Vitis vinifera]|uniref:Uncharacterized protein n=1 Tax=Vitis vinifera TaxID=29760 RepID=A0A438BWY1_VITVI|nr:hypothetical protein CK203_094683 [Vitis vinifera]